MKSSRSVAGAILMSTFATLFMAGCAHDPDVREGHGYASGATERSTPAYLGCVKSELPGRVKTYEVDADNLVKLFVDSTDPNQAGGLIEVRGTGPRQQFRAYQRDAWYDHGRLLDAALMCAKA